MQLLQVKYFSNDVSYKIKLAKQALANDSRLANRVIRIEKKWQ